MRPQCKPAAICLLLVTCASWLADDRAWKLGGLDVAWNLRLDQVFFDPPPVQDGAKVVLAAEVYERERER